MKKLKIAIFSSEYAPFICGGLGTHVVNIVSNLSRYCIIHLFVPQRKGYAPLPKNVWLHQVKVENGLEHIDYWMKYCEQAIIQLSQEAVHFDIVNCHDWMTVPVGIIMKKKYNIPFTYNVHLPQKGQLSLCLENLGLITADRIIVNSKSVYNEIQERGLTGRRMRVVPNGVDPSLFKPAKVHLKNKHTILFVGRIVPQKGVDILIKAFAAVLIKYPDLRLKIIGEGAMRLSFQRAVRYLGIPHRVDFLGWKKEQSLIKYYQSAITCIMPSHFEPFGIVALEAMACGCPVLASNTGGLQEIIRNKIDGLLFSTGDHFQLASKIVFLLNNPQILDTLSKSSRTRALSYSWSKIVKLLLADYPYLKIAKINKTAYKSNLIKLSRYSKSYILNRVAELLNS